MSTSSHYVACAGLAVVGPDGTVAIADLDVTFAERRTGLIGRNGEGKSTLLRVIAGQVVPTAGTVTTAGDVAYLPARNARQGRPDRRRSARHLRSTSGVERYRLRQYRPGSFRRLGRGVGY